MELLGDVFVPWHFYFPLVFGVGEEGYMDPCIDVWRPESVPASPSIILHLFWSHWIWTSPPGKTAWQSQAFSCLCFLACQLHRYQCNWLFTLVLGIWTQDLKLVPPQPAFWLLKYFKGKLLCSFSTYIFPWQRKTISLVCYKYKGMKCIKPREVTPEGLVTSTSVCPWPQNGKWNTALRCLSPCSGKINQNEGIENTPPWQINQINKSMKNSKVSVSFSRMEPAQSGFLLPQ